jgi:hypothetical protein
MKPVLTTTVYNESPLVRGITIWPAVVTDDRSRRTMIRPLRDSLSAGPYRYLDIQVLGHYDDRNTGLLAAAALQSLNALLGAGCLTGVTVVTLRAPLSAGLLPLSRLPLLVHLDVSGFSGAADRASLCTALALLPQLERLHVCDAGNLVDLLAATPALTHLSTVFFDGTPAPRRRRGTPPNSYATLASFQVERCATRSVRNLLPPALGDCTSLCELGSETAPLCAHVPRPLLARLLSRPELTRFFVGPFAPGLLERHAESVAWTRGRHFRFDALVRVTRPLSKFLIRIRALALTGRVRWRSCRSSLHWLLAVAPLWVFVAVVRTLEGVPLPQGQ